MKKDLSFIKEIVDGIENSTYEVTVVANDKGELIRKTTANKDFAFSKESDYVVLICQAPMTTITVGGRQMRVRESGNSNLESLTVLSEGNSVSKGLFADIKTFLNEGVDKGFIATNIKDDGKGNKTHDALLLMPIQGKFLSMACPDYTPMVKSADGTWKPRTIDYIDKLDGGKKKTRNAVFSTFKFFVPKNENAITVYEAEYKRQVEPFIVKGQPTDEPESPSTNVDKE
jgi:hypothetical protein